jgi:hypothetical protein
LRAGARARSGRKIFESWSRSQIWAEKFRELEPERDLGEKFLRAGAGARSGRKNFESRSWSESEIFQISHHCSLLFFRGIVYLPKREIKDDEERKLDSDERN